MLSLAPSPPPKKGGKVLVLSSAASVTTRQAPVWPTLVVVKDRIHGH